MIIYLYVKKCNHCGLQYFGKTERDPYRYKGSGKYWIRHINHYNIIPETSQVYTFTDIMEAERFALEFSNKNDIVESKNWANLMPENAKTGNVFGNKNPGFSEWMKTHNPAFSENNKKNKKSVILATNLRNAAAFLIEDRMEFCNSNNIPYSSIGWAIKNNKSLYDIWKFEYVSRRSHGA